MASLPFVLLGGFCCLFAYLWLANRSVSTAPQEAANLCQKPWTKDEIWQAYRKAETSPTDVRPLLFKKKNRRYIVTGGSGLVGGWVVQHLLMRGEDPAAIRIVDLTPPQRKEVHDNNIHYLQTDLSNGEAVKKAFEAPWPAHVKSLPLTVYHCAAYISPCDRSADFLQIYRKNNIDGTKNVLEAARAAGVTCLIATSSASASLKAPSYWPWPWQRWSKNIWQFIPNAEPSSRDRPLEQYSSCYAWSKARAEEIVRDANDPTTGFLTGAIRPGHAIYGHGLETSSSISWDYLTRGGSPSWIRYCVTNFVNCQNVSVGHLAYEDALLKNIDVGGKAYCVSDPNPPVRYGHMYEVLEALAHPSTPIAFPYVPHIMMLLPSYAVEAYRLLRHRYLSFLPAITGDIAFIQPAIFQMCSLHVVYTDTAAQEEIGYRAPITTLEGFVLAMVDWNAKVEAKAKAKSDQREGKETEVQNGSAIPAVPKVH